MTYEELRNIAKPHIREHDNLPSNSFLLLNQLHIPFGNEVQCEKDYDGKMNPLYNTPAFLSIKENGEKYVYFKTTTQYWNFYIFHEIAHYLLGHEKNSTQNELDANLLACILAAPIENFPTTIKTAQDLSEKCNIPIDRAEEYWQEIKHQLPKPKLSLAHKVLFVIIITATILCFIVGYVFGRKTTISEQSPITTQTPVVHTSTSPEDTLQNQEVYVTISGTKYHLPDCRYVANKTNIITEDIDTAINDGYVPCKACMK